VAFQFAICREKVNAFGDDPDAGYSLASRAPPTKGPGRVLAQPRHDKRIYLCRREHTERDELARSATTYLRIVDDLDVRRCLGFLHGATSSELERRA
jgi:hypothetical protein